jgi:YesN/AraC family two-component response regulator
VKTVLIVEDEKMIRQGLRVMIQRSGVPVEQVLECNNGLRALEILAEQKVDVMFTDIRMPKMGGLELARKVHGMKDEPLMVAVSGYDDFSYAVEMMRYGVKEYLLKPVERDKLKEVLEKLEKELTKQQSRQKEDQTLWLRQLQYELLGQLTLSQEEWEKVKRREPAFVSKGYVVCCLEKQGGTFHAGEDDLWIPQLGDWELCCIRKEQLPMLLEDNWKGHTVGISRQQVGLEKLKIGWLEAVEARKYAFWKRETARCYEGTEEKEEHPKRFVGMKNVAPGKPKVLGACVQLFGAGRSQVAMRQVKSFLANTLHAMISRNMAEDDEICRELENFWEKMRETYSNVFTEADLEQLEMFQHPYSFCSEADYETQILQFLETFTDNLEKQYKDYPNQQKMRQALNYIQENYDKNVNMAKVSNEINMSYTLFSNEFKQYTGCNFVDYVKELRMEKAKELLEQTDYLVLEISKKVGYEDEKHFMKMFKAFYGISPTAYRHNLGFHH